jgi:hypothetical protein
VILRKLAQKVAGNKYKILVAALIVAKNGNSNVSGSYCNFQNLQSSIASTCNQQMKDQKSTWQIKLAISLNKGYQPQNPNTLISIWYSNDSNACKSWSFCRMGI